MPLDPEIQAMADEIRAARLPSIRSVTVEQARAGYSARYRERSLPAPAGVETRSIAISTRAGALPARLYRPSDASEVGLLPLVVYFHGGGFVLGDAEGYELQSMHLARLGRCTVLFPEFRRAPEHRFPAALHDALDAVEWAVAQAPELGADRSRLHVMGDSAGGNLAINVALHARDHGGPALSSLMLLYPWTDFRPYCGGETYRSVEEFSHGHLLDRAVMEWFVEHYLVDPRQASDPRVSPLLAADLGRLPRTVLVTAENDPLRDMGERFAAAVAAAGGDVDYHCIAGMAHNFMGHVARSAAAREAFHTVAALLQREICRR